MIRKSLVIGSVFLAAASGLAARFSIESIQPPHWWTGMKDTSLQLQIYGENVRDAEITLKNAAGVTLDSVARLNGSPKWVYVYLTVTPEARPGEITLQLKNDGKTINKKYRLMSRKPQKGAQGFDASDVLYMIMPDRFADGNPKNNELSELRYPAKVDRKNLNVRHGGDLKGLQDHLDYIDSLGVTAVWLNPVLENDIKGGSYHGYATTDYYRVDPRFGTNGEYAAVIDSLHGRGIKTVMDMIFNHCGVTHPWFDNPPASDWFNFQGDYHQTNYRLSTITDPYSSDYDRKLTEDGWFVYGMPDLNQRNPHLMKYLIQNSIWWIEEAQIDGIRMDTYPYADYAEMGKWIDAVNAEYPDFQIVGECWFGEAAGEGFWQSGAPLAKQRGVDTRLQVVMDFPLMIASRELKPFTEKTDPWNGLNKIYDHLALDYVYANPNNVLRFLDNHDTERVILEVPENLASWRQAVAMLLTIPGIPQLYYGTELLMAGDRKKGDGNVRRDVPGGFPGDTVNNFVRGGRSPLQNEAYDFIARINQWRKDNPGILKGGMKHFMPTNGLYLYERKAKDGSRAIIIMNGVDEDNVVDMSRYEEIIEPGSRWTDVLTSETIVPVPKEGKTTFTPRQTMILMPEISGK
ncbi:MAG: glycoside hydrolase family 13 protein [Muribaculum sp.]|nr:glycoside hydrolase family 13 protein [Muribaculum sp.]